MVCDSVSCRWRESCSRLKNDLVRIKPLFPGQTAEEWPLQLAALSRLQMEIHRCSSFRWEAMKAAAWVQAGASHALPGPPTAGML